MAGGERVGRWRVAAALGVLTLGCASLQGAEGPRPDEVVRLREAARAAGLELEVPFDIDPGAVNIFTARGMINGTQTTRFFQVRQHVLGHAQGQMEFRYAPRETYTAVQALHYGRGDCVSFSNLVVALARNIHVPAYFVQVRSEPVYYAYGEQVLATTHIAVAFGEGNDMRVADLLDRSRLYAAAYFEPLGDADAMALHYNNKAVELLEAGEAAEAERLLRVLVAERPHLEELHNNLGSVLLKQGRTSEALALLQAAMERFPDSAPLLNNALRAARAEGRAELVAELEARGLQVAAHNPLFHFQLGQARLEAGDAAGAAEAFETALRLRPELPQFAEHLVEARLLAGQLEAARAAFARLAAERPSHPAVKRLRVRHPELEALVLSSGVHR